MIRQIFLSIHSPEYATQVLEQVEQGASRRYDPVRGCLLAQHPSRTAIVASNGLIETEGIVKGNNRGFPDRDDFQLERGKAETRRYAVFGDSMTSAQFLKRNWPDMAEDLASEELIKERYRGIRPAPGYPACPDHTEKGTLFELLDAPGRAAITLTDSFAMLPAASVSGFYFAHPGARYFGLGRVGKEEWNRRLFEVVARLEATFSYRMLFIGGGNARKIVSDLPVNVRKVSNDAGLVGGIRLWGGSSSRGA